ncbi:hypothetical protein TNCV_155241 [Trichonephila clavipes]|uniref:Uncharacterized protein n=1 Tax=Trichonephila clavipes TaxID=2585209 RepID=A0A8X7BK71_TRICX|nr:hypothetical protein TNCV_155241 [Trichonephila clavipes]
MPAIEIITTIDIRSKANYNFQNSHSYQIIYLSSGTPFAIYIFCCSFNIIRISATYFFNRSAPATSNSLCTSAATSLSNKVFSSSIVSMFSPSSETNLVLETSTASHTIPSTSQASAFPSIPNVQTPSASVTIMHYSKQNSSKKKEKKNYIKNQSHKSRLKRHFACPGESLMKTKI